jgi:hypothetical protein
MNSGQAKEKSPYLWFKKNKELQKDRNFNKSRGLHV